MENLSDFNVSRASNVRRKSLYGDLNLRFSLHPTLQDIRPVVDIEAVKLCVKNLLLTSFNERPFHPEIGSSISSLLFEQADVFTAISLKTEILNVIARFEPRVTETQVQIFDDHERNSYKIDVSFKITNVQDAKADLSFYLKRLR